MDPFGAVPRAPIEEPRRNHPQHGSLRPTEERLWFTIYALALAISISVWFIAIRAPLWLDETISFFLIKGGFSEIMSRQGWPDVPVYSYILWLWAKAMGTGEITLRILSVLAMLGAVYLLYLAARELFDRDVATIAVVIFCLHPIVIFASIDVRPYAFGALAINACILALVRLRHKDSNWLAALFGVLAACIVYFHFLFVVILPALAIGFFVVKSGDRRALWRQSGVALAAFALAFLPVIPGLEYMLHTRGTHVFAAAPNLAELHTTLAPGRLVFILLVTVFVAAAATRRFDLPGLFEGWRVWFCASLALVPILILYGVSVGTSIHIFVDRYQLVAIPGIALCWALVVSRIDSRTLRLLFCVAVVATFAYQCYSSPFSKRHGYTWKYALEFVERNASADGASVLICSDLPEADYVAMPLDSAKDSGLFAPLTYYKLSVPVVPLPRALNDEAIRVGSGFLRDAAERQKRFLAVGFRPSYKTLDWIAYNASGTHDVRNLGVFDGIEVLEFTPRARPDVER